MSGGRRGIGLRALAAGALSVGLVLAAQTPAFADVIKGNAGDNTLTGTPGADKIFGYRGQDTLYGKGGKDQLYGGKARDKLYGGPRGDELTGGPRRDRLYGGTGHDTLHGNNGPDLVKGGNGRDRLFGGPGNDKIRARDATRDLVGCGKGKDTAFLDWRDRMTRNHRCERVLRWVTYKDLQAMYPKRLGDKATVRKGLKSLNNQMNKPTGAGKISKNRRRAAALFATLINESRIEYNAVQSGTSRYRGRGYIQLTTRGNYRSAGSFFGVDLVGQPAKARRLAWSAKIARWYWTVARSDTNAHADRLDMYEVNRNIGYAQSWREDEQRCDDFKKALRRLSGSVPNGITCHK